jgi:hypothetical protein
MEPISPIGDEPRILPIPTTPIPVPPDEIKGIIEKMFVQKLVMTLLQEIQKSQHLFQNKA